MNKEELEEWRNECIISGHFFTAAALTKLLKEKQNGTDIAVDVQPLRTDVDGS